MSISIIYTIVSQNGTQSGTSPHCFYLDAKATTSTLYSTATEQYRKLLYKVDWQDTDASGTATWAYGADTTRLKNLSKGATGSHCYQITEGGGTKTRTPIVRVTDGVSVATRSDVTLTVVDPAITYATTNTICFENVATGTGGPAGCTYVTTSSFATVRSNLLSGRRLLLKRDDTFDASGNTNWNNVDGPWCIDDWGGGTNKPKIRATANGTYLIQYGNTAGPYDDVCIADVELAGNGFTSVSGATYSEFGPNSRVAYRHDGMLFLRVTGTLLARGIWFMQQYYIHAIDCNIAVKTGADSANVVYGEWVYSSILGCLLEQPETADLGNGLLRNGHPMGMVLSNNTLRGAQYQRQHVKLHNALVASPVAENFIVSCNKFESYAADSGIDATHGDEWWVGAGPDNDTDHQELGTWIFEDNWTTGSANGKRFFYIEIGIGTIRNNFFDLSRGFSGEVRPIAIFFSGPAAQPVIDDVEVYNNTAYSTLVNTGVGAGNGFSMIMLDDGAQSGGGANASTHVVSRNNIRYTPNFTTQTMLHDPYGHIFAQSNNTVVADPAATWVSSNGVGTGTFTVPSDFRLRTSAPEVGTGFDTTVLDDFFQNYRIGQTNSKGFHQSPAGSDPFGAGVTIPPAIVPRSVYVMP